MLVCKCFTFCSRVNYSSYRGQFFVNTNDHIVTFSGWCCDTEYLGVSFWYCLFGRISIKWSNATNERVFETKRIADDSCCQCNCVLQAGDAFRYIEKAEFRLVRVDSSKILAYFNRFCVYHAMFVLGIIAWHTRAAASSSTPCTTTLRASASGTTAASSRTRRAAASSSSSSPAPSATSAAARTATTGSGSDVRAFLAKRSRPHAAQQLQEAQQNHVESGTHISIEQHGARATALRLLRNEQPVARSDRSTNLIRRREFDLLLRDRRLL